MHGIQLCTCNLIHVLHCMRKTFKIYKVGHEIFHVIYVFSIMGHFLQSPWVAVGNRVFPYNLTVKHTSKGHLTFYQFDNRMGLAHPSTEMRMIAFYLMWSP